MRMGYRLADQVTFCSVSGRLVFLDLRRDRYFCLDGPLESAFQALLTLGEAPEDGVERLVSAGVIDRARLGAALMAPQLSPPPTRSLLDQPPSDTACGATRVAEVAWRVCRAGIVLRRRALETILERIRLSRPSAGSDPVPLGAIMALAAGFSHARRYVPLARRCLLDSLALLDFLGSRRMFADLVFGVRLNPFGAHCWVQSGDMVLNDRLEHTGLHTPILVV